MARRELIDADALLGVINEHMKSLNDCRNLHVGAVVRDNTRANGANWTTHGLRQSGGDHDRIACAEAISDFMRHLQAQYDVRW